MRDSTKSINAEFDQDLVEGVVDLISRITQSDLVILHPYLQEENRYLPPIMNGEILYSNSLKVAYADSSSVVHLLNLKNKPIFAEDSAELYSVTKTDDLKRKKFSDKEKILSTIAIPLKSADGPIGILFINYRKRQKFDSMQKQLIRSLGAYSAIAISNSRQLQEFRLRRLKELEALRQIERGINQTLDTGKILKTILELTTTYIRADTGVILLHNKRANTIEAKAAIGENLLPLEQQVYQLDEMKGIAQTAFKNKTSIRIDNVKSDSALSDKFTEMSERTRSELDVPLILGDEVIGVMNFESASEEAFTEDDQKFIETLAGQAVIAIKNAVEYARAQRIAKEREALIDIVNTLLLQTDQEEIFSIILKKALEITETSKGTISTCDEDRREIRTAAQIGLKQGWENTVLNFDEGISGKVAREKQFIKIDKMSTDPLREEFLDVFSGEEESELAVPILDGDKVIGIINLESEHPYHFEDDDVELVKSLASLCAIAIKNAEIIHEKQLASVGIITGDISHKMNSPLSLIQKQIELLKMNSEDELARNNYLADKIEKINSIASDAIQMVQRSLDQAKRSFSTVERTSLKLILKKTLQEIKIPENITIVENISESKEALDVLATTELTNVFHNLLTNAFHAMPDGGKVFISLESVDKNWIKVSVEDSGKGIPEELAPLVFLGVSEKGTEGRGFGLPLTKAYIEMIGGKIDAPVSGKNNYGAKFTIHLRSAQV